MSSTLSAGVLDRIEELLEALTPEERAEVTYEAYEGQVGGQEGESLDRDFWFVGPTDGTPQLEQGGDITVVEYSFELRVRLSSAPYDAKTFPRAIANESAAIRRELDANTTWGAAGVLEVIVGALRVEPQGQDVDLVWVIRANVQEE